jgi:wobble nucleotide-excising tRNase
MLLKVEKIEEIGRFATLRQQAAQFGKLTLVFARNGYGKSTVCSVLRSAAEQDPKAIEARRKLGAVAESKVHLHWQTKGAVTFATGKWNVCPGQLLVFDQEYVRRNLHVADSVTRDNKRSLLPVILGDRGVALAAQINALDEEQRELVKEQAQAEKTIRTAFPVLTDIRVFALTPISDEIDAEIESAAKQVELARKAFAVGQRQQFNPLPKIDIERFETLARRGLEAVSQTAASVVANHIETHAMQPAGQRWLDFGVKHMTGDACPFCDQDTSDVAAVQAFKGYFSAEFAALTSEVESALDDLKGALGTEASALKVALAEGAANVEFWSSVCDLPARPSLSDTEATRTIAALQALTELMERKQRDPLAPLDLIDRSAVLAAASDVAAYNLKIAAANVAIVAAKEEAANADLSRVREILEKRQALKARLSSPISSEVQDWITRDTRRAQVETEKAAAQTELKSFTLASVGQRQDVINELLMLFGANFRITDTKANFVGREANTEFSIAIGAHSVKAGDRQENKPSFMTVLSAGDKYTLALAFFIAHLRARTDLADCIIVFDDPFSSQDLYRQFETTSQLRALAKDACQVLVLSHDPRFLDMIARNERDPCRMVQILCDDTGNGSIRDWSSADELKTDYLKQSECIREYAGTGNLLKDTTVESLVKDIRPFLESFLKARFPGRFAELVMLDGMINEVEMAGASDPAFKDVASLRALNEFTRPNHHGGAVTPDAGAVRAQCKRVVAIVGSY